MGRGLGPDGQGSYGILLGAYTDRHLANLKSIGAARRDPARRPSRRVGMRRSRGPRRAALTALFVLAAGGNAQTPPAPVPLSPGTALERAFAAGETQVFDADLTAGRLYPLTVEQRGIHLVVDVRGPDGGSLAAVDSPLDRWGIETVLLRPAATGSYRIEVRAASEGRRARPLRDPPGRDPGVYSRRAADRERSAPWPR